MKWKRTLPELLLLSVLILAFNIRQTESLYPPPTEWTQTYGISDNHNETRSLIQTDDGGYAMLGFTQHWETGWAYTLDFWLVKTGTGGDVNGDGVVDIFDLSIVGLAYGSFEGDPDYNPDADLTRDGLVDARDLAIVTLNYGRG